MNYHELTEALLSLLRCDVSECEESVVKDVLLELRLCINVSSRQFTMSEFEEEELRRLCRRYSFSGEGTVLRLVGYSYLNVV